MAEVKSVDNDIVETKKFDESTGEMHTRHTYDPTEVIKQNIATKNESNELGKGRYKHGKLPLVKVGSIHMGDIIRLKGLGYDLMANDPDERRRALVYIQENEPHLMAVPGKPFAKKKEVWV